MKNLLFMVLFFTTCYSVYAADAFSTVEERMSGKEFKETGMVKLTDDELALLNEWLRNHSVATMGNATASQTIPQGGSNMIPLTTIDTRGLGYLGVESSHDPDDKVIYGTIDGTIDGWAKRDTLFKLANGMIWEQTEKDAYSINPVTNPEVTITKSLLGNWHLSFVGHEADVRVKRIQ